MDKRKAKNLENDLMGQNIGGYEIIEFINYGKSAAVFKAKDISGNIIALKIFDEELIGLTGQAIQERHINQELGLKEHTIEGLVKIIDGGKYNHFGREFHFIAMEYIDGKNLKQYIESESYDEEFIKKNLNSLIAVTEELIKKGIAHRDIKPENVMIDKNGNLILMDLGVLKLIGHYNTDNEKTEKQFLATQRYSPPELFFGEEKNDINGWRAINLYQIGGVLHDLIMKKELFHGKSPYGNIVKAIQDEMPVITAGGYSDDLVNLTRSLLIKDPNSRLRLASTEKINAYITNNDNQDSFELELQKNRNTSDSYKVKLIDIDRIKKSKEEIIAAKQRLLKESTDTLKRIIYELKKDGIKNEGLFNDCKLGEHFTTTNKNAEFQKHSVINIPVRITAAFDCGLPRNLYFNISLMINENSECRVSLFAFIAGIGISEDLNEFGHMILQVINPGRIIPKKHSFQIPTTSRQYQDTRPLIENFTETIIFEGVFSNDDSFKRPIKTFIAKFINKGIELTKEETEAELEYQKAVFEGKERRVLIPNKKTIIVSLN